MWLRLCRLGYLVPVRTADLPDALRFLDHARAFALTELGCDPMRLTVLLATWSATAEARLDPDDVRPLVDGIYGLPLPPARTLGGLRADLLDPANRFQENEGSAVLQFLGPELLLKAGLVEEDGAGHRRPATVTPLVAPFVIDGLMADAEGIKSAL